MTQLDHTMQHISEAPAIQTKFDVAVDVLRPKRGLHWARIAGLVLAGGADIVLAIPAFDGVLRGWTGTSIFCASAFAVITVLAAFSSGHELKLDHRGLAIVCASATIALIAAIFELRIFAASLQASALYGGAAQPTNAAANEVPIASVMAALMIATSAIAFVDGWITTPLRQVTQLRTLDTALTAAGIALAIGEGQVARLDEDLAMAEYQLAHIDIDLEDAFHGLDAAMRELQELARTEIARNLCRPAATSHLDLPL